MKKLDVSFIVPVYNSASTLEETILKINEAISSSDFTAEIIVVNDGSTDGMEKLDLFKDSTIKLINQKNEGRFIARKNGIDASSGRYIFLVDARVHVFKTCLSFIEKEIKKNKNNCVWNGFIEIEPDSLYAGFMDGLAKLGWWGYFKNPRRADYGLEDFDSYPKGTGCFFAPAKDLKAANELFLQTTKDVKNSSDDTHLIRLLAEKYRINLDPRFGAIYFARSKLSQVPKHAYKRGRFFVDGFLRRGTRFYKHLVAIYFLSIAAVPALIVLSSWVGLGNLLVVAIASLALFMVLLVCALTYLRIRPLNTVLGFSAYFPVFFGFYYLGILTSGVKLAALKMKENK